MYHTQFKGQFGCTKLATVLSEAFQLWRQGKTYKWEVKYRLGDNIPNWTSNVGRALLWLSKSNGNIVSEIAASVMANRSELYDLGPRKFVKKIVKETVSDVCHRPITPIYQVLWTDGWALIKAAAKLVVYRLQNPMQPRFIDKTWIDVVDMIHD